MKSNNKGPCSECPAHCASLFNDLPTSELEKIMQKKSVHHFRKGEIIYHQDTSCFGVHCLESGTVKIFTQEEDGKEIINRISKAGDLLGHTSLFGEKKYRESAKALEATSCCFIETAEIKELLQSSPNLSTFFMQKISQELFESNLRNADMVRKNVRERLANYFIKMSKHLGHEKNSQMFFTPHLSREEIASYIGSAHETVIRCISEFKELGYIHEENKTFYILNKDKLNHLSGQTNHEIHSRSEC